MPRLINLGMPAYSTTRNLNQALFVLSAVFFICSCAEIIP